MTQPKFKLGDLVRKTKGSQWSGVVVGTYSTELTPEGYAVESSSEKGSVQIYPAGALESAPLYFGPRASAACLEEQLEKAQAELAELRLKAADRNSWQDVAAKVSKQRDELLEEVEQLQKASVPICIGRPLIQKLAAEGQLVSMDGQSLVAADSLFKKDPYIELEKAQTEVRVLRQDNEHHVNRCYAAEKARNEAQEEVKRLTERLSQTDWDAAHYARLCDGKDREISALHRQIAAAEQLFIALDAVKEEMVNLGHVTERVKRLADAAPTAWPEANK